MTRKQSCLDEAACLPRRSRTKAGVLDCARQAKRDAAFLVGRCRQARCSRAATVPRLIKPNQAFPRLLKPFFKNPFLSLCILNPSTCNFQRRISDAYVNLCKAMSTYVNHPRGASPPTCPSEPLQGQASAGKHFLPHWGCPLSPVILFSFFRKLSMLRALCH
jgi:hypothetical protein